MAAALAAMLAPRGGLAQSAGDHSDSARESARLAIPWRELAPEDRRRVSEIVADASLYRCLPTRVIDCDDRLFVYLIDHPELVVDCWNVMGISQLSLDARAPGKYAAADPAGAKGELRVVHRSEDNAGAVTMVVLADGEYQAGPMPHAIYGGSVMLLRASAAEQDNGRCYVTARLDSFIRFERKATELVARTFRPLIVRTADHNFIETMRFVSLFSRTAETNPTGMARLAQQLDSVDPATRREFAAVCQATSDRYAARRVRAERVAQAVALPLSVIR
ncbi:hypothetical protein [Botrimarina sp.]|uniref:hypothetical protein n=1 Tax=Botrimarina sp. TaxID=2795802 RepID=UPI0032EF3E09